nr:DUF4035 domain-containing protein [Herbidospora mongoliensis]
MIYEQMAGPLGSARGDYQSAQVTAAILNVNRKRGKRALTVADLVFRWDRREPMSPQELYERIKQINTQLGGTDARTTPEPETD